MFKHLTVLAPGLLGGSLAMAVHELGLAEKITVWARRSDLAERCAQQSWCDQATHVLHNAVAEADFIVICSPIDAIIELCRKISPHLADGAIVTDVGSTKGAITRECSKLLSEKGHFVGSHPMAGSEKSGLDHASAKLFRDKPCLITATPTTDGEALKKVHVFWQELGMIIHLLEPSEHDHIVASISHLPHLLASSLAAYLQGRSESATFVQCSGNGLKDTTRIAAGSPELWKSILLQNSDAILAETKGFSQTWEGLLSALKAKDEKALTQLLQSGKNFRDLLG